MILPSADFVLRRRLRSELVPPVAVGAGVASAVGAAAGVSAGVGVAMVVSTGEATGVGVAVSTGVALAVGSGAAAVGAGVVIGVDAGSTTVGSGSGASAGVAVPSTAAYIAATASAMAKMRRVMMGACVRAGWGGRWPSRRGGEDLDAQRIDTAAQRLEFAGWVEDPSFGSLSLKYSLRDS